MQILTECVPKEPKDDKSSRKAGLLNKPSLEGRRRQWRIGVRCRIASAHRDEKPEMLPVWRNLRGRVARTGQCGRHFWHARAGASAVEFAIVSPLVIIAIIEIIQAGFDFYQTSQLAQATASAARQLQVGAVGGLAPTLSEFKAQFLCPRLGAGMACASLILSIQTVQPGIAPNGFYAYVKSDQSDIIRVATDGSPTPYCPGQPSSYVYIQAAYAMPVFSPAWIMLGSTSNGQKVHFLNASAVFRNEPYDSASQVPAKC